MSSPRGFVCGFYGARDRYEVPAALHESGRLELLLTDFYGNALPSASGGRARRTSDALPRSKVRASILLTLARRVCGRLFSDPEKQHAWTDKVLSVRIASESSRRNANIFTYEPYVVIRPPGGFSGGRKQIVFYYHPHVDTEDEIVGKDQDLFAGCYGHTRVSASPHRRRTADAWRHADLVVCASSFTKRSLVAAGMPEETAVVVPYGAGLPGGARGAAGELSDASRKSGPLRLLFVGRNPTRKGLHHLLTAWNSACRQPGDSLTIVSGPSAVGLKGLADESDNVNWSVSVPSEQLQRLYAESDALVLPSLCEGFGHVYLEAMALGCPVVGTRNSALPDIGTRDQGVFVVDAGNVGDLAALISQASRNPGLFRGLGGAARLRAAEFTWTKVRRGICAAVGSVA